MQPWEIFDLDNPSLQQAFVDLKGKEPPLSPHSSELVVLIQREMDERSIAYEVFTALDGGTAAVMGTQGSEDEAPDDDTEGYRVGDGGRAWLQYCPPWYCLPTPSVPAPIEEGGDETSKVPDAVKEAGRYRTMWDDSSDSNSDYEVVRPPKPKIKRASASAGRMTPQGFFVTGPVRRKKKQSVPVQPLPDKRPPVPAFRKNAAIATPAGTSKPPPTVISKPSSKRPPPPSRSCQTPPPTFKLLRGLPPSHTRAQSAASPKMEPPQPPGLPRSHHEELLDNDSLSDATSNISNPHSGDVTEAIEPTDEKPIGTVNPLVEGGPVVVGSCEGVHTTLHLGVAVSQEEDPLLTVEINGHKEPAHSEGSLPNASLTSALAETGALSTHSEPAHPAIASGHEPTDTVPTEGVCVMEEPALAAELVASVSEAIPTVSPAGVELHDTGDTPLRPKKNDSPHKSEVVSYAVEEVPTAKSCTPGTPIAESIYDDSVAQSATTTKVVVPQEVAEMTPPNSYGNYFSRFEDILIEPFHLRPYSELPQNVVVAALQRFITELEACKVECADIDVDDAFNQFICKVQKSRSEVYELITDCLLSNDETNTNREWIEADGAAWNVWWSWKRPLPQDSIWLITQSVNHIPKAAAIARKDLLKRHVQRYARGRGPGAAAFKNLAPLTFTLPTEYVPFTQCFAEVRGVWIMKTVGMSRGRGITITDSIEHVTYSDPVVIQRYVDRPLLLAPSGNPSSPRTHKFDLRLYVVVTQFSPLECFISHLGLARIAGRKYDPSNLSDLQAHLTNTAVSNALRSANAGTVLPLDQTKWTLWALERYVEEALGIGTWAQVWPRVCETVLKSLACAEDAIPAHPCCFELFGFDVLLDEDLSAWLLEVNASPAMDIDCQQDEDTKPRLIREIVRLLDPLPTNRDALLKVVKRRVHEATKKRRRKPSSQEEALQRDEDLEAIFEGRFPRRYGEMPSCMGEFERLAPSAQYNKIIALKKVCV